MYLCCLGVVSVLMNLTRLLYCTLNILSVTVIVVIIAVVAITTTFTTSLVIVWFTCHTSLDTCQHRHNDVAFPCYYRWSTFVGITHMSCSLSSVSATLGLEYTKIQTDLVCGGHHSFPMEIGEELMRKTLWRLVLLSPQYSWELCIFHLNGRLPDEPGLAHCSPSSLSWTFSQDKLKLFISTGYFGLYQIHLR